MRVTVIFPDNTIGVDGDFRSFASVNPDDPNWRVIQWYGTYGNIEVYQGEGIWLDKIDLLMQRMKLATGYYASPNYVTVD